MLELLLWRVFMSHKRVYELARDLGIPSKHLVEELRDHGIDIKSHMSTLDEDTAELVLDLYREATVQGGNVPPEEVAAVPKSPVSEQATAIVATPPPTERTIPTQPSKPAKPDGVSAPSHPMSETNGKVLRLSEALTIKDFAAALQLTAKDVL